MQAPGQGKPSSSGRPRKRTIEDFEEEDLYLPTNGRKRYRVRCLPKQWSALSCAGSQGNGPPA